MFNIANKTWVKNLLILLRPLLNADLKKNSELKRQLVLLKEMKLSTYLLFQIFTNIYVHTKPYQILFVVTVFVCQNC